jgi:preprotein translocase subunit SecA
MSGRASERIAQLMDQLGMGADEVIQHPMVDRSIMRAQQKLAKAAPNAVPTRSADEWFASNLPRRG